jgi:hypothetical protein
LPQIVRPADVRAADPGRRPDGDPRVAAQQHLQPVHVHLPDKGCPGEELLFGLGQGTRGAETGAGHIHAEIRPVDALFPSPGLHGDGRARGKQGVQLTAAAHPGSEVRAAYADDGQGRFHLELVRIGLDDFPRDHAEHAHGEFDGHGFFALGLEAEIGQADLARFLDFEHALVAKDDAGGRSRAGGHEVMGVHLVLEPQGSAAQVRMGGRDLALDSVQIAGRSLGRPGGRFQSEKQRKHEQACQNPHLGQPVVDADGEAHHTDKPSCVSGRVPAVRGAG